MDINLKNVETYNQNNLENEKKNFNWKQYINNYKDIEESGIKTKDDAWIHWINFGKKENRTYENLCDSEFELFNWEQYINNYEDLKKSHINSKNSAWVHWKQYGKNEGRIWIVCIENKIEDNTNDLSSSLNNLNEVLILKDDQTKNIVKQDTCINENKTNILLEEQANYNDFFDNKIENLDWDLYFEKYQYKH